MHQQTTNNHQEPLFFKCRLQSLFYIYVCFPIFWPCTYSPFCLEAVDTHLKVEKLCKYRALRMWNIWASAGVSPFSWLLATVNKKLYIIRGVTSEPLCEIKFLNLWKYLWLHHLSGKMSLVSADSVILPLDMGPKFFHVVLYEYLSVFLTHPIKVLHFKKWKKYLWF